MSSFQVSRGTPRSAFVPSPVFVGILALVVVSAWMAWSGFGNVRFDVFLFVISGWVLSLCLHEYAHALIAYFSGDRGVAERGYLRLNPLKYTHPVLSIVLPLIAVVLGGIGLPGGAVWVDHAYIRSKAKESLISAAGPLTNVVFALLLAIPFVFGAADDALISTGYGLSLGPHGDFWLGLAALAFLQVTASLLNFLPVPGLDGGNILRPWLSPAYQRAYNLFAPYGFLLLFVLLWQSQINVYFFDAVNWLTRLIGVPDDFGQVGLAYMRFWSN
ncbi:site-2 protease family protein [Actinoplanes sp. N902-109]|uniref:site-2 protease family protein n=1 Tax=Actinoplanes sp. (strain N902-109) TaxID=649831 RepID=UPI0003296645|nr:site-2 protease family protein [Actinoplanes sp. N902-109]AGL15381.1 peptidase M50 [Actinoplanes sp. N902-109]